MSEQPEPDPEPESLPGLAGLLKARRDELIDHWLRATRRENTADPLPRAELVDRIPIFIDELILALHPDALPLPSLGETAVEHGAQRFGLGFNVAEVIREYGILHRAILDLATASAVTIQLGEHHLISRWLNAGIASAISQYVSERDAELHRSASEHLGFIAHEIRNPLSSARMAFDLLTRGDAVHAKRASELLGRNLRRVADVIDNALNQASLKMGLVPRLSRIPLLPFLEEIDLDASAEAGAKDITVVVDGAADLTIEADARLLRSAVSNLLYNAIKFSRPGSTVVLRGSSAPGEVTIEVADGCGGLPPGRAEELFVPLVQRGNDHSGFGLGLAIAMQAAEAHNGSIRVRDVPGVGCIFTVNLPARSDRGP
jgi:signal transduction histidine kinase